MELAEEDLRKNAEKPEGEAAQKKHGSNTPIFDFVTYFESFIDAVALIDQNPAGDDKACNENNTKDNPCYEAASLLRAPKSNRLL